MIVKDEYKSSDINVYNDYCYCPMCGSKVRFIGTSNQGDRLYHCDNCYITWLGWSVIKYKE